MRHHWKAVGTLLLAASAVWMLVAGQHLAITGRGSVESHPSGTTALRSPLAGTAAAALEPARQRGDEPDGHAAEGDETLTARRARRVGVRGTMILVEPGAGTPAAPPHEGTPDGGPPPREPLDPLHHGFSRDDLLRSVVVESPTLRASGPVDSQGAFVLEGDLPTGVETVRVRFTSNLLMPEHGKSTARVSVGPTSPEPYVVFRVRPALIATPRYRGKVITPTDLNDPAVREEFLRQMNDVANLFLAPPDAPGPPPG